MLFPLIFLLASTIASSQIQNVFPKQFRWCVATSAHQVEGQNINSDWWNFELRGNTIRNGDVSGNASFHWNRYVEDADLMKNLGVTDYRLSVEWAKIEPREGQFDEEAIEHYRKELEELSTRSIRPIITLHHFTFPQWLADKGGWEWEGSDEAFENFTRVVHSFAKDYVSDWVTINEPMIYTMNGYQAGVFPPGEKRPLQQIVPVIRGLLRAHARSYHLLHRLAKDNGQNVRVGVAHSLRIFDPWNKFSPVDLYATNRANALWNWSIPDAIKTGRLRLHLLWFLHANEKIEGLKGTQDFFGVNYYSGDLIQFALPEGIRTRGRSLLEHNDLGWDIYPDGLRRLLLSVHRRYPQQKIMITENGIADASDTMRPKFLMDHLNAVLQAIDQGVPVEGYCHWSLLDNFEWAEGFAPRFGLYQVNYLTGERTETESARLFRKIIFANGLSF